MNIVLASVVSVVFMFVCLLLVFKVTGGSWKVSLDMAVGAVLGMLIGMAIVSTMVFIFLALI